MRMRTGSSASKPASSRTSRRKPSTVVSPSSRRPPGVTHASPQPAAATWRIKRTRPRPSWRSPPGPERVFGRPKRRVVRRDDDFPFLYRNPSEPVERIRESVFAHSGAHRPSQGWEAYLTPPRVSGPRTEGSRVPLEDVSDRANKAYETMKSAGITSEDKMRDAEAITKMSKLPKNFVLQALQELQSKGYAKRRAREKAAGYWLIK